VSAKKPLCGNVSLDKTDLAVFAIVSLVYSLSTLMALLMLTGDSGCSPWKRELFSPSAKLPVDSYTKMSDVPRGSSLLSRY
jgi:hypothetical protein